MKESEINKKRQEQNKKQLSCILLRDAGNKYPDVPPINEKHRNEIFMYSGYAS